MDKKKSVNNKPKLTFGQIAADKVTLWFGSWIFIVGVLLFIFAWAAMNYYFLFVSWDPYPFILLNLMLSCLASLQAPIILMSQNRSAERDRIKNERDFAINRKSEREAEKILKELDSIKRLVRKKR